MSNLRSDELLIARLFDLPAADRAAFWQHACALDPDLGRRHPEFARLFAGGGSPPADPVASLASSLSDHAMAEVFATALGATDREVPGTHIGHYKLLQKIGEGGFGSVWMAEQIEPIRRRVALKIVKTGMDTEEVVARFEAERQALALMDHPNIARVFDAGATPAGRPFFVMELVRGVAITRYCDDNRLGTIGRLRLFIAVCQAVQHAHQKGVIHRDLKPSNILVTLHDGKPVPKVIDFGIAKATDQPLTAKTLVTRFHSFVGTPAYTSPEQMEMSGLDVDTRSDIYSLGVLLYELLAGRPPFDPDALMKSGLEAMRRTIREVDPPRPSLRLGTLPAADRTSVAHARGTDAVRLSLLLRGDVDWIVMHCLEKDRTRRYESASALARDVERHLANEPVTARPPSSLYRLQKLYHRHKLAFGAAVAVALSLVGGLITASVLLVRERTAHARAAAAEAAENGLRRQAEAARAEEAVRAGRTSLALAEQLFREGRASEGLAHLVRAARSDPANTAVGPRLVAALAYRSFAEPVGVPLQNPVSANLVFYSLGGSHCLCWGGDTLRLWDLASGKLRQTIDTGDSVCGDQSPGGELVATGSAAGEVSVWSLESGRRVLGPLRLGQRVRVVRFSPDGRRLAAGSDDHRVRIWDVATGNLETVLPLDYPVYEVAFARDGSRVLTATLRGPARIWRLPDGAPVTPYLAMESTIKGGGGNVTGGAFSPDGRLVAVTDQRGAQFFDAATGAMVGARLEHPDTCYSVQFTRDGTKAVTTSNDGTARVWAVPSGRPLLRLVHGGRLSRRAHLTPDDRYLVTASYDGAARVWDLATGHLAFEPVRAGDVIEVDLTPDGREFLTGGRDGVARRWRLEPGDAQPFLLPADPTRLLVQRDADGSSAAWAIYPDRLQRIDLLTGAAMGAPHAFPVPIQRAILAPDQRHLYVHCGPAGHELWELQDAGVARRPLGQFTAETVEFSADSSHLALADQVNTVRVWRTDTGTLVSAPIENASRSLAFSPDSRRLAVIMADNSTVVWDLTSGRPAGETMRLRSDSINVRFSPDGRLLATASLEGTAQIWDAASLRSIGPPLLHRPILRGAVFSRDSRRLLTWTSQETRTWDVATGRPLTEPIVGGDNIQVAVFSEDGTRVATLARATNHVHLWGAVSGQLLADPVALGDTVGLPGRLGFISSDRFLSVSTLRGGNAVWPVPPQSGHNPVPDWLLRLATAVAGGEIDAHAIFRERVAVAADFEPFRRELGALPDSAPYVEWGRWFLADRATRPIAPGLTTTAAQVPPSAEPTSDDHEP